MTLSPDEFIRRFLLHVLPKGFHRIRHYGLLASAGRKANVARARELLDAPAPPASATFRCQIRLCHAHAAAVAWSSSRSFSVRLGRARHQRRIPHRDRRVVTRHDEPQPAVEARRLRPVGRHVPASITRPTTAMSPAKSPCLPPSQHLHDAPTQLNYHQLSQVNPIPQSPHHSYSRSRILKSP